MFDFGLDTQKIITLIYVITLWLIGYLLARKCRAFTATHMSHRFSKHHSQIISRLLFYIILLLFLFSGIKQLGFNLTVFLGAAGIFTVAISFASQTAASNLISGIFMLFEQPFKIGDTLEIQDITGTVESIDLMSTKLKTPDNKLIRIPNETLIKSKITNLSFYKERALTCTVNINLQSNITQARNLLMQVANDNPFVLKNYPVDVCVEAFLDGGIVLQLITWVRNKNLKNTKTQLYENIKTVFDQEGIALVDPNTTCR